MGVTYLDTLIFGGYREVRDEGVPVPASSILDFVGSGVSATSVDGVTRVAIDNGYSRVQSNGFNQPQRAIVDFRGFNIADDAGNAKTIVSLGTPVVTGETLTWDAALGKWVTDGLDARFAGDVTLVSGFGVYWESFSERKPGIHGSENTLALGSLDWALIGAAVGSVGTHIWLVGDTGTFADVRMSLNNTALTLGVVNLIVGGSFISLGSSPAPTGDIRLSNGGGGIRFNSNPGGTAIAGLRCDSANDIIVGETTTNPAIRLHANQAFHLTIGSTAVAGATANTFDINTGVALRSLATAAADATGATHQFFKGRNGAAVQSGDFIGLFQFLGFDGTNYLERAQIRSRVTDTVDDGDVPLSLEFLTGRTSLELRLAIDHNGTADFQGGDITTTGDVLLGGSSSVYFDGSIGLLGTSTTLSVGSGSMSLVGFVASEGGAFRWFDGPDGIPDIIMSLTEAGGLVLVPGLTVDFGISRALGGGSSATLGTIGGSGPANAAQNRWLEVRIEGTTYWAPVWT